MNKEEIQKARSIVGELFYDEKAITQWQYELLEMVVDVAQIKVKNNCDLAHVSGSFISVSEQEPPHNTELLAKSPTGTIHLCHWRPAYNIFTCQAKSESSWNWSWKLI